MEEGTEPLHQRCAGHRHSLLAFVRGASWGRYLLGIANRRYRMDRLCRFLWSWRNCVECTKKIQGGDHSEHAGIRRRGTFFASKDVPAGLSKDELSSHRAEAKSCFYSMKHIRMEALLIARLPFGSIGWSAAFSVGSSWKKPILSKDWFVKGLRQTDLSPMRI